MLDEPLGLGESVLAGCRVEHEQHLGDLGLLLDHATDFCELVHETALGLEAAGRVDQHDIDALPLRTFHGLEGDGCRILTLLLRTLNGGTAALRPGGQLLDGRRAEGVGRTDDHAAAVAAQKLRELADGGGLADAIDSDHKHHRGTRAERESGIEAGEPLLEGLAQHPLQVHRVGRVETLDARTQLFDDRLGEIHAEIGGD